MVSSGIDYTSVECPVCFAAIGQPCVETASPGHPCVLAYQHSARIEIAANVAGILAGGDAEPISEAQIDATGLV